MNNSEVESLLLIDNRARDIEIEELKRSLEFAHELIRAQKSEIDNVKMEHRNATRKINTLMEDFSKLVSLAAKDHDRLVYLDDYGRRSSLRFKGVAEEPRETWEQCQAAILRILREKLGKSPEIERAHRLGKKRYGVNRDIIVKFLRYPDKEFIFNNRGRLSSSGITVKEDFCTETADVRASFSPEIKLGSEG